jgi:hypothetical protein
MSVLDDLNRLNFDGQAITIVDEQIKVHGQSRSINVCRNTENRESAELLKLLGNAGDVVKFKARYHDVSSLAATGGARILQFSILLCSCLTIALCPRFAATLQLNLNIRTLERFQSQRGAQIVDLLHVHDQILLRSDEENFTKL